MSILFWPSWLLGRVIEIVGLEMFEDGWALIGPFQEVLVLPRCSPLELEFRRYLLENFWDPPCPPCPLLMRLFLRARSHSNLIRPNVLFSRPGRSVGCQTHRELIELSDSESGSTYHTNSPPPAVRRAPLSYPVSPLSDAPTLGSYSPSF